MVTTAVLYLRVSTASQADVGASLQAQERLLVDAATSKRWDFNLVVDAGHSAKTLNRPGMKYALDILERGEAQHLMALRVDRITRRTSDFEDILDRSVRQGWDMLLLSPKVGTSTAEGRYAARLQAASAEYESELMGLRTKEGMAQRRLEGVKLGRPSGVSDETRALITELRSNGMSLRLIADELHARCVPTAQGAKMWYASSVKTILDAELTAEQ